jgi:hypothetical protein
MVICSIMAISGGAYLAYSLMQGYVLNQRLHAMEATHERLERLRSASYDKIKPLNLDYALYYIERSGTKWVVNVSDPNETYPLIGLQMPIQTTVQYKDIDAGVPSYDYLHVVVRTGYRSGQPDRVKQETYLVP